MMAVLRAEWTKFRTVPGWVFAMIGAAVAIVAFGVGPSMSGSCGKDGPQSECHLPTGPGGEEVADNFFFVHQSLAGDGSLTARVSSLTGLVPAPDTGHEGPMQTKPGLVPWAKAGLMVKAGTRPGAAYAAVMVTGGHGVRMQDNFTHDVAGPLASYPVWLRITRVGDTVTGAESVDGTRWSTVATVHLAGLPATVQAGLFAASPDYTEAVSGFGGNGAMTGPAQATAAFQDLSRHGTWPAGDWTGEHIGGPDNAGPLRLGGFRQDNGRVEVSGSGDIAPSVSGPAGIGTTVTQTLVGTFIGLIVAVVVGAMYMTAEYRRGLIRTTLLANPRRGQALAAKAVVVGGIAYLAGLVSAAVVLAVGQKVLRANGVYVHPATLGTEVRLVLGTGALLAVGAVLALAIGTVLRRGAVAIAAVIVVIVLPYLLSISVLPLGAARWVLTVTPAAGFAVQQSAVRYPQVDNVYSPVDGFFPLPGWAGFGVLCAWTVAALVLATVLLRRRDA